MGLAQVVEHLLSKRGTLSSNPSHPKKKKVNVIPYIKIHGLGEWLKR
jgi:hypothetical protein